MFTKGQLIPYRLVSPGFEAAYTGEQSETPIDEKGWPFTRYTDDQGNVIQRWSVWTWTPQNGEANWSPEIIALNQIQTSLGDLGDETRRLRAHIGSLVLCDPGIPVTIDELLLAIGRGQMDERPFNNGCWCYSLCWEVAGTQPRHDEAMQTIEACLRAYLGGQSSAELILRYPQVEGFIERAFAWLGPVDDLTEVQKLMFERMLLPFDYFSKRNFDFEAMERDFFQEGGRGQQLDEQIARLADLPKIFPDYRKEFFENMQSIQEPEKQELYRICGAIAHSLHHLSDCHHSMYRWIESWIHGIGTGKWEIPTRKAGVERERLAKLLFGYTLGLDSWLSGKTMQFLLLDLGHLDLGCDPKNEILRVYAYLGEEWTPLKEWLAGCLWYNLMGGGNPRGWIIQQPLIDRAREVGVDTREWIDLLLKK